MEESYIPKGHISYGTLEGDLLFEQDNMVVKSGRQAIFNKLLKNKNFEINSVAFGSGNKKVVNEDTDLEKPLTAEELNNLDIKYGKIVGTDIQEVNDFFINEDEDERKITIIVFLRLKESATDNVIITELGLKLKTPNILFSRTTHKPVHISKIVGKKLIYTVKF